MGEGDQGKGKEERGKRPGEETKEGVSKGEVELDDAKPSAD